MKREIDLIDQRVGELEFPDRLVRISEFGAISGGVADATTAIQDAIDHIAAQGGGRVLVEAGEYLTGPLELKSWVELHLEIDAVLKFDPDPARYLPPVESRWQGVVLRNLKPLIRAADAHHIAITGSGTLDGGADRQHWWPWGGVESYGWADGGTKQADGWSKLETMVAAGTPALQRVSDPSWGLRPAFVEFLRCEDVLVEDVGIIRSPFWTLHPILTKRFRARGVTIVSGGPNNDGCDPEACTDVIIEDCVFHVGDDCIAIKAGRAIEGEPIGEPTRNVVIRDCLMRSRYGAVTIGSEMSGGVENVYVSNCRTSGSGVFNGIYIKTNASRGGWLRNLWVSGLHCDRLGGDLVNIDFHRGEGTEGPFTPQVSGIHLEDITAVRCRRYLFIRGFEHSPIREITLPRNLVEGEADEPNVTEHVELRELTH